MNYARIALAVAVTGADAAVEGTGNARTCDSFLAEISIFEKFLTGAPTSAVMRPLPTEIVTCINPLDSAITAGQFIEIGQCIDETWVALGGGGGVSIGGLQAVIFQVLERSGGAEAASNHCEDQLLDAANFYEARVLFRPCGVPRVSEETDAGTIVVYDELGSFLANREDAEAQGKIGVAIYMLEENGYDCVWVITFIDWWREVQVIHDIIHTDSEIRFKVKKIKVWDDCDLDDVVIPLIDCQDAS